MERVRAQSWSKTSTQVRIPGGTNDESLTVVGNTLYFQGNDGTHGRELWKSDGTSIGTVMVKDIYSGSGSGYPQDLTAMGNILYFQADDGHERLRTMEE